MQGLVLLLARAACLGSTVASFDGDTQRLAPCTWMEPYLSFQGQRFSLFIAIYILVSAWRQINMHFDRRMYSIGT